MEAVTLEVYVPDIVGVPVLDPVTVFEGDQVGVTDGPEPEPTCNKQLDTVVLGREEAKVTPT